MLEADTTTPGRPERLSARLILLLAPILGLLDLPDHRESRAVDADDESLEFAGFVERFLADNLAEPLNLEDVAAQFNVSVPTLTRRFHLQSGLSVMARLQAMRMQQAVDLLRTTPMSVKEVGMAVGLPEPSYFCRCFRRVYGTSPRRYQPDESRTA